MKLAKINITDLTAINVSIPKRVSEVLKLTYIRDDARGIGVSIPKRVSEVLKPNTSIVSLKFKLVVSIPKRVLEVLKLTKCL